MRSRACTGSDYGLKLVPLKWTKQRVHWRLSLFHFYTSYWKTAPKKSPIMRPSSMANVFASSARMLVVVVHDVPQHSVFECNSWCFLLLFGVTSYKDMPAYARLSKLNSSPRSRIVNACYGRTVHSGLEPMMGMLLSRLSWRLYHWTALVLGAL